MGSRRAAERAEKQSNSDAEMDALVQEVHENFAADGGMQEAVMAVLTGMSGSMVF
jgi:hypothetical protein